LLDSVITSPPVGATPLILTVPVDETPPFTLVGLRVSDVTIGAVTISTALLVDEPRTPVIVADCWLATGTVLMVKVALALPAGTVTVAGTVVPDRLVESFTAMPPVDALPESVIVPTEEAPPSTELGFKVTDVRVGGLIVSVAVTVTPFSAAETTAAV